MNTPSAEPRPTLLSPVDNTLTDSLATTFEWTGIPQASGYRIEVAEDPDFEQMTVEADVQNSTSLTLYDALPLDGASLWWRVTARVRDRVVQSATSSFRAAVDFTERGITAAPANSAGGVATTPGVTQGIATASYPVGDNSSFALMVGLWVALTIALTVTVFTRIL